MTLQIDPLAAFVFVVAVAVATGVFKYTARSHATGPSRGDLVGAIASGACVGTLLLAFLTLTPVPASPALPEPPTISSSADPAVR
ncbi:hypothetical protein AB0L68_40750 [Streptomyces sp. NPDC052164]|uniref:hypothetical protein n=1 Tax=Streptomyces sp. NPDC052164 TaxID=3155529 RepID=UPI003436A630